MNKGVGSERNIPLTFGKDLDIVRVANPVKRPFSMKELIIGFFLPKTNRIVEKVVILCLVIFTLFVGLSCGHCGVQGQPSLDGARDFSEQIIKAIISECIGEPELGIIAVAFVFKTRLEKGMSLGSVGYKRKDIDEFIARQPKKKVQLVRDIFRDIFSDTGTIKNPVPNAKYFENIELYGKPEWCKVLVKKIGNHSFYY